MRLIQRIYGNRGEGVYITRVKLTPRTRWGQLLLHVFHRGDEDPDPHDHPWDFWTIPLNRGYLEAARDDDGYLIVEYVPARRLTRRSAEHTHRVLSGWNKFPIFTLLWTGPVRREWGFRIRATGHWVYWRDYLERNQYD